jgi:predicted RNase H-like nuclease (RuvC/YqgF family)
VGFEVEKRQDRLEDAIERLTEISSDLNKMIAVHEQRINQNERSVSILENVVEKRREESDLKLKDVYETIRNEDRNIISELNKMREEQKNQHAEISKKMTAMEKIIWIYMGGFTVVIFLITNGSAIFKLFK